MAVPVGSTVAFPNFDSIYHNVFSLSKTQARSTSACTRTARRARSSSTSRASSGSAATSTRTCRRTSIVVDAPHYVVAEQDGSFSFKSLAPGKYKVQAWSEQSGEPVISEVTIKAGDNQTNLDLKGGAAQGPSEDKFGGTRAQ